MSEQLKNVRGRQPHHGSSVQLVNMLWPITIGKERTSKAEDRNDEGYKSRPIMHRRSLSLGSCPFISQSWFLPPPPAGGATRRHPSLNARSSPRRGIPNRFNIYLHCQLNSDCDAVMRFLLCFCYLWTLVMRRRCASSFLSQLTEYILLQGDAKRGRSRPYWDNLNYRFRLICCHNDEWPR